MLGFDLSVMNTFTCKEMQLICDDPQLLKYPQIVTNTRR
jgi:hypothetical protein